MTSIAASEIEFISPPYDLSTFKSLHKQLFQDIYEWAGEVRTIDTSKDQTRFCTADRIVPEADKIFRRLQAENWLEGLSRAELIKRIAEYYGDLNVVHPFREGNGRAQRLLFEQIIINAGFQIDWWPVGEGEWLQANVDAVSCHFETLEHVFERCIGEAVTG